MKKGEGVGRGKIEGEDENEEDSRKVLAAPQRPPCQF